ncbi:MAG: SGNH/GDSL hydrolase family protein [Bacteroidales bacterium]|nr:SGNH/GDSL hydrolase family protein [Bacteroidales bacterium]
MKRLLILITAFTIILGVNAAKKEAQDSIRVLFIGNSFTFYNKMPEMVRTIAKNQKKNLAVTSITKGGQRLRGHLQNKELLEILKKGGWDFVIVQEQSTDPALPTDSVKALVYPYAHTLDSLIHAGSPKAKTIFYMTWGHKYGFRESKPHYPLMNTYDGMFHRLYTSYLEMTYDNNAICAPVGMAWDIVRKERPNLIMYKQDSYHPSRAGSYLIANVIYCTMFPKWYQCTYTADLQEETADYLQQVAQNTVMNNLRLLNIEK